MKPVLETKNVRFAYAQKDILIDIDLQVNAGEFLGLIGPNGSGKTTLLKVLSGLLSPQAGAIMYCDRNLFTMKRSELARKLAYVPQSNEGAFPFTAAEIVMMGRYAHLEDRMFERPDDIQLCQVVMRATDTLQFADKNFDELSGGEKQRVIIASALAQNPKILFLDEPTASLDINYQTQLLDLLSGLSRRQGLTLVAAMHDLNLAALFCQRLLMIHQGRIVADGRPAEVLNKANIKRVYDTDAHFVKADGDGRFFIFPEARPGTLRDG